MPEYFSFDYVEEQMGEPIIGIVHVGAHYAEEAHEYHQRGYPALWFEAHPEYALRMWDTIKAYPEQHGIEGLLSDTDNEEVDFWITADEYASSMLKPAFHQEQNPHAPIVNKIKLHTRRYDTFVNRVKEHAWWFDYNLLILDVQGAELKVWEGFGEYQNNFKAIISEYSTVEFYEGVPRIEDLDAAYSKYRRVTPEKGTELIHADALYVRSEA